MFFQVCPSCQWPASTSGLICVCFCVFVYESFFFVREDYFYAGAADLQIADFVFDPLQVL